MKTECKSCGDSFERGQEPQYNGEILITGFRSKEDFGLVAQMCERFKTWEGRNVTSTEGLSVAMREDILMDGKPYCEAFCHSDNGRLVVCLKPVECFEATKLDAQRGIWQRIQDWIDPIPTWNAFFMLVAVLILTVCWLVVILVNK